MTKAELFDAIETAAKDHLLPPFGLFPTQRGISPNATPHNAAASNRAEVLRSPHFV